MQGIDVSSQNVGSGGGFGGFGGGGWEGLLFGWLLGEGGIGGRRGEVDQSAFVAAMNAQSDQTKVVLQQLTGQIAELQNSVGQDKISAQVETLKDLLVSLSNAKNLADQAAFNNLSTQLSTCCCSINTKLAEISGQILTSTQTVINRVGDLENTMDRQFCELKRGQEKTDALIETTALKQSMDRKDDKIHSLETALSEQRIIAAVSNGGGHGGSSCSAPGNSGNTPSSD